MIEQIGFYGKLPCFGDFIKRNVSPDVLEKWDTWLTPALEQAKIHLREHWQANYLNAPIWRFILPVNSLVEHTVAGIMMPSVDKVGRFYCFSIFIKLSDSDSYIKLTSVLNEYLSHLEEFALSLLDQAQLDLEQVQQELESSVTRFSADNQLDMAPAQGLCDNELVSIGLADANKVEQALAPIVDELLLKDTVVFTIWWTDGSQHQSPQLRLFSAMPMAQCFYSFLDQEEPE